MEKICGIYLITCTKPNGDRLYYAGQSSHCKRRKLEHFGALRRGNHNNQFMQRTFNKYGEASFTFDVVETCLPHHLNERESAWVKPLAGLPFSFNIAIEPGATTRGLKHSEEARHSNSLKHTGKRHTEETKRRIAQAQLGTKRGPASEERKKKISEAQIGSKNHMYGKTGFLHHRSKAVISTNLQTRQERIYGSICEAVKDGFSFASISGVCNNKWKTHRGHAFRFASEKENKLLSPSR